MKKLINIGITALFSIIYFYVTLPAINIQSEEFYMYIILTCMVYMICSVLTGAVRASATVMG